MSSLDEWRSEAYENAKLFKEKVKRWHYKRIVKREFNIGDKVLLYRSHLRFFARKLISKWEGPFVVEEVYRSGAIKINNFQGTNPQVVNGQSLKYYLSSDPYNKRADIVRVLTPDDHIRAIYPIRPESELK